MWLEVNDNLINAAVHTWLVKLFKQSTKHKDIKVRLWNIFRCNKAVLFLTVNKYKKQFDAINYCVYYG